MSFSHPTYGAITADIFLFFNTTLAYSVAVVFSNDSSSDSCAVLFTDNYGDLIATTKFVNRYICLYTIVVIYDAMCYI